MEKHPKTLEEELLLLQKKTSGASLSIEEILYILSGKGRVLILILLSLPFCQPIQIPGLSTPFGLVIAFFGLRMAFGKHVWLPKAILSKKIDPQTIKSILDKTLSLIRKMKQWIHPRLSWLSQHPFMQIANGLIIAILGVFLALPLPIPLSNLTAAWAILLIALGILEDDGLFVLLGYTIFASTIIAFALMAITVKSWVIAGNFHGI